LRIARRAIHEQEEEHAGKAQAQKVSERHYLLLTYRYERLNLPDSPDAAKRYTVTLVDTEADGAVSVK